MDIGKQQRVIMVEPLDTNMGLPEMVDAPATGNVERDEEGFVRTGEEPELLRRPRLPSSPIDGS